MEMRRKEDKKVTKGEGVRKAGKWKMKKKRKVPKERWKRRMTRTRSRWIQGLVCEVRRELGRERRKSKKEKRNMKRRD